MTWSTFDCDVINYRLDCDVSVESLQLYHDVIIFVNHDYDCVLCSPVIVLPHDWENPGGNPP